MNYNCINISVPYVYGELLYILAFQRSTQASTRCLSVYSTLTLRTKQHTCTCARTHNSLSSLKLATYPELWFGKVLAVAVERVVTRSRHAIR